MTVSCSARDAALIVLGVAPDDSAGLFVNGGASGCDTYSISTSNPDGSQIAVVMQEALDSAGVNPQDIVALKAHGTASPLNDDAEAAGMHQVFGDLPPFFALKPYVGHTLGACGAVETALLAAAISAGELPSSGGFADFDAALAVRPVSKPIPAPDGHYLLNYFGFGGNNASVVIEQVGCDV